MKRLVKHDDKYFYHTLQNQRVTNNSPKVNRSLFVTKHASPTNNQYSRRIPIPSSEELNNSDSTQEYDDSNESEISGTKSLPLPFKNHITLPKTSKSFPQSSPQSLDPSYEEAESFSSTSSEFEYVFKRPELTSTPKMTQCLDNTNRVPFTDDKATQCWLQEVKLYVEQECTTSLQCKSIAMELNQKVNRLAACTTIILRGLLSHCRCIEMDFNQVNIKPNHENLFLIRNVAKSIMDFLKIYTQQPRHHIQKLYDQLEATHSPEITVRISNLLLDEWRKVQKHVLFEEVKKLVEKLEDPTTDLDLRATIVGITSVCLRNMDLINYFLRADIVSVLLILCERCNGPSLRTLILRALSTMCSKSEGIKCFEKFSGLQIVTDILQDDTRPEPERSEAVALLAQVTAPWLEDSFELKDLQEYSKKLIKSLTRFSESTKCCQNLLLCAAALANLSSLNRAHILEMAHVKTATVLLKATRNRGPLVSLYLLEQIATLLGNMATVENIRDELKKAKAPAALVGFLRMRNFHKDDAERRLQQKSIIAMSRLCGDPEMSKEVVINGGVTRLVQLCREQDERFNSDAILVAALATLRKIVEACGKDIMDPQDYQELVEPKLLDSFLTYSTQNESYV
ncbi:hypothetical protein ABEB36_000363 [Hypothenemus hampei]